MSLAVGKKYKVRSWADMEKKFGYTTTGSIACPCSFTIHMKPYCGKTLTIAEVRQGYRGNLIYRVKEDGGMFFWSEQMFTQENLISWYL